MNPEEKIKQLAKDLLSTTKPVPIILELLNSFENQSNEIKNIIQTAFISFFDSLKGNTNLESIKNIFQSLKTKIEPAENPLTIEFLDTALKACQIIETKPSPDMNEVYQSLIRTFSCAYKTDGSTLCCPKCKSTDVYEGELSMYEFTDLNCRNCGHQELADDYQIERWYEQNYNEKYNQKNRGL